MNVLIAAGGDQKRWGNPYPKQLVTVWKECLIDRLIRQFLPYTDDIVILSKNPLIRQRYPDNCFLPYDHRWLVETLYETRYFWSERVIFLLGDTVLTNRTVSRIVNEVDYPLKFWGNSTDILALTADDTHQRCWELCLYAAARHAMFEGGRGKLWEAYRIYCGIEPDEDKRDSDGIFTGTMDWSMDFDMVREYEMFLAAIRNGEINDNL